MNVIDRIKKGDPQTGAVEDPDVIVKMQMASDAKSGGKAAQ
jgi:hypothetical protein